MGRWAAETSRVRVSARSRPLPPFIPTLISLRAFDLVSSPVWWEAATNTYIYIYIYIYIYSEVGFKFVFHSYVYIYIYIYANFIKHNRHFMSTYFLLDPFEFPYYFYCILGELIYVLSIVACIPSTFCPTLGHHQGRIYYKSNVTFVLAYYNCVRRLCRWRFLAFVFECDSIFSASS